MRATTVHRLFDAVTHGNLRAVDALLDAGVPANVRNGEGQTPLIAAAAAGRAEVVARLLARGARLNVRRDPLLGLQEPIILPSLHDALSRATALLEEAKRTPPPDEAGSITDDLLLYANPMLTAAAAGHADVVAVLLDGGASPNAQQWDETPPLVGAAAAGHLEVVGLLLEAGAEVDAGSGFTALEEAVMRGHAGIVDRLLAAGADANRHDEDGGTVLMLAAAQGDLDVVRRLVRAGADVNAVFDGEAALSCAAAYGKLNVYAYLLPRSAPRVRQIGERALDTYLQYAGEL